MARISIATILILLVSLGLLYSSNAVIYKHDISITHVDWGGGARTGTRANITATVTVENVSNESQSFRVTLVWDHNPVSWKTIVNLAPNDTTTVFVSGIVDDPPTGHIIGVIAGDAALFTVAERPPGYGQTETPNWLTSLTESFLDWLVGSVSGITIVILLLIFASLLVSRRTMSSSHAT